MAYTTIDNPELYFQTKLYTGNYSTQSITLDGSENMQPDWVWLKKRSGTENHILTDSVRGATKTIRSNTTDAENTESEYLKSFDSDGFTLGTRSEPNGSGATFASWNWKASGSTVTNTEGNVNTTISANPTAGFSIISADPGSTSGELTLGHGLGTVPTMMIWKNRETAGQNWQVFHQATGTGLTILNLANAKNTDVTFWNTHTTTLFKMTTHMYAQNKDFIGYCFSDRKGFSKFGSYTGNGNADGTFVYTGFKPAMVIFKNTGTSNRQWQLLDNKRSSSGGNNVINITISPNNNNDESWWGTNNYADFLSNGFKLRASYDGVNESGGNYIYMAFAESPFVNSNGIPNNAR